ncbi:MULTISPECIES: DUF6950 family protein [Citrobacter freundii complex]|nr:ornithine carbamoyltransferase [Citrobacter freundii]
MDLYTLIMKAMSTTYSLGSNDCNIMALQVIDLRAGTGWEQVAKYKTIKQGIKQLKELGYISTGDIVREYSDEVTHPIDGDIWIDSENPLIMGVVFSNRLVGVNTEHNEFKLIAIPLDGKFYRVRKYNG